MKLIVRLFVIALAVTGAVATTSANGSTKTTVVAAKTSAMPVPNCPPNTGNCGMDQW
jgi:hypothetical protein